MDLGSILFIIAMVIFVVWFVVYPHLGYKPMILNRQKHSDDSTLLARYDRILNAIRELDFDRTIGKVSDEDYPLQRALLLKQGADILRILERSQVPSGSQVNASFDDDLEIKIAERRLSRQEKISAVCPQCAMPVLQSDESCWKCGTKLS